MGNFCKSSNKGGFLRAIGCVSRRFSIFHYLRKREFLVVLKLNLDMSNFVRNPISIMSTLPCLLDLSVLFNSMRLSPRLSRGAFFISRTFYFQLAQSMGINCYGHTSVCLIWLSFFKNLKTAHSSLAMKSWMWSDRFPSIMKAFDSSQILRCPCLLEIVAVQTQTVIFEEHSIDRGNIMKPCLFTSNFTSSNNNI